ncbi:hypothetical protein CIB54_07050 [Pseudomonas fluorescens]|uniref:Uncharacterized protein n=1 Tax=Pseudomonas fluorescens TaxID=294 RepID=A0A2N1EB88_PSEFL|nr:hypothetical protein CIB54_07050 [Pseudomonas fluorescens]
MREIIYRNPSDMRMCGTYPPELLELDGTKFLTVHDRQGGTYEGTKVSIECEVEHVRPEWVLTINLSGGGIKKFKASEISAMTRHI